MAKQKRTSLEKILTLETKKVAKLLFYTYLTPSIITKIMHRKAWENCKEKNQQGFVMPYIRDCLKEWKEAGFIEKSPVKLPFLVEKKTGKSYWLKNYGYRLNLESLYYYCKEIHNIDFTKKEKEVINKRVGLEVMRKRIFREYPNDDIINAILKFYIKQYAIPPHIEVLSEEGKRWLKIAEKMGKKTHELIEKEKKKENLKKRKPSKKIPMIIWEREIEKKCMEDTLETFVDKKTGKLKVPMKDLQMYVKLEELMLYITSYRKHPKLISSINLNFKKALGILA